MWRTVRAPVTAGTACERSRRKPAPDAHGRHGSCDRSPSDDALLACVSCLSIYKGDMLSGLVLAAAQSELENREVAIATDRGDTQRWAGCGALAVQVSGMHEAATDGEVSPFSTTQKRNQDS